MDEKISLLELLGGCICVSCGTPVLQLVVQPTCSQPGRDGIAAKSEVLAQSVEKPSEAAVSVSQIEQEIAEAWRHDLAQWGASHSHDISTWNGGSEFTL